MGLALKIELSSRQQEIIQVLLQKPAPVSSRNIAKNLEVSVRTIQRDLKELQTIFSKYSLVVQKNRKKGIWLEGSEKKRQQLYNDLYFQEKKRMFSQDERQLGLLFDLLLAHEPIKFYYFSHRYGVTESTISNDMNVLEDWMNGFGLELIRKPGLGVYIESQEHALRTTAVYNMTKHLSVDEWLGFFNTGKFSTNNYFTKKILRETLSVNQLPHLEKSVRQTLSSQNIALDDRDYVHLILHLYFAVIRVKNGFLIPSFKGQTDIYNKKDKRLAREISRLVSKYLYVELPEQEVIYISLKLLIMKRISNSEIVINENDSYIPIDTLMAFVEDTGKSLGVSLIGDPILMEGLISHLHSAVTRLKNDMPIQNPLLTKIMEDYKNVFQACEQAIPVLENSLKVSIPKTEIGYITLHIGAAAIRISDSSLTKSRAVVVCTSGIGTGRFLATRIKKEISGVEVVEVVSMMALKDWLDTHKVEMIISTVSLPSLEDRKNVVTVSPFLQDEDILSIEAAVREFEEKKTGDSPSKTKSNLDTSHLLSVARYGEAISQVIRNLFLYVDIDFNDIDQVMSHLQPLDMMKDITQLTNDIKEREKLGGFTWGRLALLHSRTKSVSQLMMAVFRLNDPIRWQSSKNEYNEVETLLVLAAPSGAPKEHIETISEISSAMIEEDFMDSLLNDSGEMLREYVENVLTAFYKEKANLFDERI